MTGRRRSDSGSGHGFRRRSGSGSRSSSGASVGFAPGPAGGRDDDRGQTLQDYTVGIGLFLLTLAAVLTTFMGFTNPFWQGVGSEEVAESDRIASTVVGNFSSPSTPNEIRTAQFETIADDDPEKLRGRWGLDNGTSVNVTINTLNGTDVVTSGGTTLTAGRAYTGQSAAASARIVTLSTGECEPACRLVVRTW